MPLNLPILTINYPDGLTWTHKIGVIHGFFMKFWDMIKHLSILVMVLYPIIYSCYSTISFKSINWPYNQNRLIMFCFTFWLEKNINNVLFCCGFWFWIILQTQFFFSTIINVVGYNRWKILGKQLYPKYHFFILEVYMGWPHDYQTKIVTINWPVKVIILCIEIQVWWFSFFIGSYGGQFIFFSNTSSIMHAC